MKLFKLAGCVLAGCIWSMAVSAQSAAQAPRAITLRFHNEVGAKALTLFTETYQDPFGEPLVITKFKYYISDISLQRPGKADTLLSDQCYLIDEADSVSRTVVLPYAGGAVDAITFELGVDSIWNVSGAQSGSLDPLNGMFWTWNTGYIFAKLEGTSDSSHAQEHLLNWDIGGYKQGQNAERSVTLLVHDGTGTLSRVIDIDADVEAWFNTRHPIHLTQSPVCHQPGALAMTLADNYARMFSVGNP